MNIRGFETEYDTFLMIFMEIDNQYPEKVKKYIRKLFSHFYFLNVDVEGTVSQNFDIGPGSFSIKY